MGLTINYEQLAKKAKLVKRSDKSGRRKKFHPRSANPTPEIPQPQTAAHLSKLEVPVGVKRYYLSIPSGKQKQAWDAQCKWDSSIRRWYVDDPEFLSDFTAWKPSLVNSKAVA